MTYAAASLAGILAWLAGVAANSRARRLRALAKLRTEPIAGVEAASQARRAVTFADGSRVVFVQTPDLDALLRERRRAERGRA